jgi:hypothetical protein
MFTIQLNHPQLLAALAPTGEVRICANLLLTIGVAPAIQEAN